MRISGIFQLLVGCAVVAAMAVTLTMSFAALVYTGTLAPYLGEGVFFALLGGAAMAAIGAFAHSIGGTIANPQDVTAVLLGAAAAGIATAGVASGDALFPTVLALVAAGSVVAGVTVFLAGLLRLGSLVRYVPYSVVAGFLAATGYLLVMGALGIVSRENVTVFNVATVLGEMPVAHWLPWVASGLGLAFLTKHVPGDVAVPLALCLAAVAFFSVLAATGLSLETALAQGLLLGPFLDTDAGDVLSGGFFALVDWRAIASATPTLAAVAGLTLLGAMLNTTSFAMESGQSSDVERDMRATGLSNIAAAAVGGMPGYLILSESILAQRMGMKGFLPGLAAALACAGAVFAGTEYLAYVPAGLMAMVVSYLGFDLLGSWLLESRHRLPASEFVVVGLIVLTAATLGVLEALTLGMLAAAAIFIVSYANTGVLRFRSTAATRRSRVERSEEAMQHLSRTGDACVVLELSGYVFFGTADRLARIVGAELQKHEIRFVIIDFGRVTGLDASAVLTLTKVLEAARAGRVEVTFCAMQPEQKLQFLQSGTNRDDLRFDESTDAALERVEDRLLAEADLGNTVAGPSLLELVEKLEAEFAGSPDVVRRIELSPGDELLSKGAASSEVYVLVEGRLRAEIETADGARLRVAEFREAALVGELAFYAGVARTAWVSAERPSVVVRINLDRAETKASPTLLSFHKVAARSLARRVIRMTEYTRELNS